MPPDFPWILAAIILAAVAWTVPKLLNQLRRLATWTLKTLGSAIGRQVVVALESHLQPLWEADFQDVLDDALAPLYHELRNNGGTSLKDVVNRSASDIRQIQKDIEPLVREYNARRFDPPEGTPA